MRAKVAASIKAWHAGDTETAIAQRERWKQFTHLPKTEKSIQKMRSSLITRGHRPKIRGGNGQGLTAPQAKLLQELGTGWIPEHAVSLGKRTAGYPTHYKIDIANPSLMMAVEIDGNSHATRQRRMADAKKDEALSVRGWTVLRFSNEETLNMTDDVKAKILSRFTTSQ